MTGENDNNVTLNIGEMFLKLFGEMRETTAILNEVKDSIKENSNSMRNMVERQARTESSDSVRDEKIAALERRADSASKEREDNEKARLADKKELLEAIGKERDFRNKMLGALAAGEAIIIILQGLQLLGVLG